MASLWKDYKFMMEYISRVRFNTIIFGGALRDSLLHDFHAKEFYLKNKVTKLKYEDPLNYPETSERLLIPSDIDFVIKECDFIKLKEAIESKWFIRRKKYMDMSYITPVEKGEYVLNTYEVLFNGHIIKLDVIISYGDKPLIMPFMENDCDVNQLLYTRKRSYYLRNTSDKIELFNVICNIKNKNAVCGSNIKQYRLLKMMEKGWDIKVIYKIYKFIPFTVSDEKCIICHSDFNKDTTQKHRYMVRFIKCNCNYVVCLKCIKKNWKTMNKCLMCRYEYFIDETVPSGDLVIFQQCMMHDRAKSYESETKSETKT